MMRWRILKKKILRGLPRGSVVGGKGEKKGLIEPSPPSENQRYPWLCSCGVRCSGPFRVENGLVLMMVCDDDDAKNYQ